MPATFDLVALLAKHWSGQLLVASQQIWDGPNGSWASKDSDRNDRRGRKALSFQGRSKSLEESNKASRPVNRRLYSGRSDHRSSKPSRFSEYALQGIAGDGAKLALWGLYRAGFRAVAFVHDEVLIELPIGSDHAAATKRIDRILCETMEELTGSIPIACEYALSDPWYKAAEAVFNEKGQRQLWKPTLEISH